MTTRAVPAGPDRRIRSILSLAAAVLFLVLFVVLSLVPAACSTEPDIPLDVPEGWIADERGSWWIAGVDTARAFRDLSTFEAMGARVPDALYRPGEPLAAQPEVARERMIGAVQRELAPLYRNRPETVDSLFWQYVAPNVQAARPDRDPDEQVTEYEREAYRRIMRHFRAPAARTHIGTDIPVLLPDSLRTKASDLAVSFQVYVDDTGAPVAVRQLDGVHPVLDRIALRALVQVRWQPAYVLRTSRSVPVDGWVRLGVRFPASGSPE